ncbi:site-specific integrase [soil metagenome]
MTKRLTPIRLKSLPVRDKQYTVTTERRGLLVRVSPGGSKSFVYRYALAGRTRWLSLGTWPAMTLEQAHTAHAEAAERVRQGIDVAEAKGTARKREIEAGTVAELAEEFMARHVTRKRKRPDLVRQILDANVLPEWGQRKAKHVTRRDAVLLLDEIVDRGSPIMANRTASIIKQMFAFGVDRGSLDGSPLVGLNPPGGEEPKRERVLTDDEIRAFWSKLDECGMQPELRHALRLLLLTGQRRVELALARWEHFAGDVWTIPAELSKSSREHAVPLAAGALELLAEIRAVTGESEWLLPSPRTAAPRSGGPIDPKALTRAVSRNRAKFAIPAFTVHDLRRTCYTGLQSLGIDPQTVSRVVNHKSPGMQGTYGRYDFLPEKRQALALWAEYVADVVSARRSKVKSIRARA